MRRRAGFTLIEVLIVMAILVVLAGITYPMFAGIGESIHQTAVHATVRQVRDLVEYHGALRDVSLSWEGYPDTIDPRWFNGGVLPRDPWTMQPMKIQVVHGPKEATVPNKKTFNIRPDGLPAGHTAWYNAANGSFCAKVPNEGSEEEILELFRLANGLESIPGGS